ncbi:MAG: dihydroorotate dehydrogenase electron transfer subunit [Clostridium sp.]|uniref:dihydroorotate dehydrogenase electron transfer subunit n=1 Tax=Clostridium sp. TaxID=1506 RepID=UPI002FC5A9DE
MPLSYNKSKVISNKHIVDNIYVMEVDIKADVKPGQFYMLRGWGCEPILPRPISINDYKDGVLSFLYMVVGSGTEYFKNLETGDKIELLGPLGNGFPMDRLKGKVAVVAGGIGIAPMVHTLKEMSAEKVDIYAGFANNSYGLEEMEDLASKVDIATVTGNEGHKGFCTDNFNPGDYDVVISCGPEAMMKKVASMCNDADVECYVSMENHMACGIGACLVCTCKTKNGNKRACKEGPVFSSKDVIFGE